MSVRLIAELTYLHAMCRPDNPGGICKSVRLFHDSWVQTHLACVAAYASLNYTVWVGLQSSMARREAACLRMCCSASCRDGRPTCCAMSANDSVR